MGIVVAKRTKPVRVVWVEDPDVTPTRAGLKGWILEADATLADGADVFEVRPLDSAQRLAAAASDKEERIFRTVAEGVISINGQTSVTEGKQRTPLSQYLRRVPVAALADLCVYILAISDGEDPQAHYGAGDVGDDAEPDPAEPDPNA